MPTWSLLLITAILLLCLWNGVRGTLLEWPAMPLRKKVFSVFVSVLWAAITVRVGVELVERLLPWK